MTPSELLRKCRTYPTVLDFDQELDLIRAARGISVDEIRDDIDSFESIVSIIQLSHSDSGIFEMDESSEQIVNEFYKWIVSLESLLGTGCRLRDQADGLQLTCGEIRRLMSGDGRGATSG